jgi:5'-3' exonuclease
MGVKGLWKLLLPIGRRISIETLEGRIVAVDASIWLTQFVKAMRDPETGKLCAGAHIIGFFRRLCRLRYHGIRPVFVFDGAAPEIKRREIMRRRRRREQFASLGSADIQRLARKILAENLKKSRKGDVKDDKSEEKTEGQSGAAAAVTSTAAANAAEAASFDPGFNPGEVDTAEAAVSGVATSSDRRDGDSLHVAGPASEDSGEENDWDEDPNSEESQVGSGDDTSHKNGGDDDVFDRAAQLYGNGEFDVDLMANLPASKRKDAVERAQRRRRMDARKDFMPAAADPIKFSNAQLSSFLKTCKLNRDIAAAAKKAARRDNLHDAMASDRATLVELLREEDGTANDEDDDKQYDGESEEENRKPAASDAGSDALKSVEQVSRTPKGIRKATRGVKRWSENDSDSDDDLFHDDVPEPSVNRLQRGRVMLDDDCGSEGGQPGGFYPGSPFVATAVAGESEGPSPDRKTASGPALLRQDLMDYELAVALQEAENDGGDVAPDRSSIDPSASTDVIDLTSPSDDESNCRTASCDAEMSSAHLGASRTLHGSQSTGAELSSSTRRNIIAKYPSDDTIGSTSVEDREVQSSVHLLTQGNACSMHRGEGLFEKSPAKSKDDHSSPSGADDEEDVDWEDGASNCPTAMIVEDRAVRSSAGLLTQGTTCTMHRVEGLLEERPGKSKDDHSSPSGADDEEDVDWVDGASNCQTAVRTESRIESPAFDTTDDDWNDAARPSAEADATAVALERGFETASRLTNWAGVAFRRAMVASGQVASKSPSGDKNQVVEQGGDTHYEATAEVFATRDAASPEVAFTQTLLNSTPTAQVGSDDESEDLDLQPTASGGISKSKSIRFDDDDIQRWKTERNSRERDMETITEDMREEVIQLLQLFGVPYVGKCHDRSFFSHSFEFRLARVSCLPRTRVLEAPAEAEAQCAELERLGLVHGIVTEDSDVFVFGGKTVYKNIFEDQKYAEAYNADDAAKEMRLGRNEIVALAMLLGGDYTEGVRGVGIVNAMEILETFTMDEGTKEGLLKFKEWLEGISLDDCVVDGSVDGVQLKRFHEKHRAARTRWTTPDGFPAENVMQAYFNPVVDRSEGRFTWARPDAEKLIHFCQRYVGWSPNETKQYLDPVMTKLESGLRQTRLDSYMKYEDRIQFADVRSKRLRQVLGLSLPDAGKKADAATPSKRRKRIT